jgi:hypothetical protein
MGHVPYRRLISGSVVAALLWPLLVVLMTGVHVFMEHAQDHDVADTVATALHGHEHEAGTAPHEHDAAPTNGKARVPSLGLIAAVGPCAPMAPADAATTCLLGTAKRSPPQAPTASPPILRV